MGGAAAPAAGAVGNRGVNGLTSSAAAAKQTAPARGVRMLVRRAIGVILIQLSPGRTYS